MHTHIQFVPNQINKLGPFVEFYTGLAYSSGLAQTVYNSDISFNNTIETNIGPHVDYRLMDNLTRNHGQQLAQDGPLRYLDPWDCETLLNTFTQKENADFENAQFMVNILNLW